MNFGRVVRTVRFLRPQQVWWQVVYRLRRPRFVEYEAPKPVGRMRVDAVPRPQSMLSDGSFEFLNIRDEFRGWNNREHGMLWAYNQNYMDWLNQLEMTQSAGAEWIDRFIAGIDGNTVGLDPYPTALRIINWVKFFCRYPKEAIKRRLDSLYSQSRYLRRRLERHLLGNHLLEDAYALYIADCFFGQKPDTGLLMRELREQVLPDGAHYEQSVMYHCILLDRLLDCLNMGVRAEELRAVAVRMLGHLESIVWADGSMPTVNDAAEGIAPAAAEIFDYARRLGLTWTPLPLRECGYRKLSDGGIELLADVGGITASYQPGHSHADALNYELRIDGQPIVIDTGISTYNKTPRRQYERSTEAHNTVTPASGGDSAEVWGGFRVGRRCKVDIREDSPLRLSASHNAFGGHCRTFELTDGSLKITDRFRGAGISRIHLAPGVDPARVKVSGADRIEVRDCRVSNRYNRFETTKVVEVHFRGEMTYEII